MMRHAHEGAAGAPSGPGDVLVPESPTLRQPVAVGFDGSPASHRALLWAAEEARLRNTVLNIVHVAELPVPPTGGKPQQSTTGVDAGIEGHQETADCVSSLDLAGYADVATTMTLAWDDPVDGLVRATADAVMMVVGGHDARGIRAVLFGSTAQRTAGRAHCPVAVVRARSGATGPSTHDDRVIVGVGDLSACAAAVALAFEEAHLRNVGVTAVHAWSATPQEISAEVAWGGSPGPQAESMALLRETTSTARTAYPDVDVSYLATMGRPAEILTELSAVARLLVVGSSRRSTLSEIFLGSTSGELIRQANCPVIVASTPRKPAR